ncbi:hypothetical protein OV320_1318 [Actinobacteria bacterium OV320]|nr:hypothetical protein OV320_1318 [Actinobacteria bacterium OV320]
MLSLSLAWEYTVNNASTGKGKARGLRLVVRPTAEIWLVAR